MSATEPVVDVASAFDPETVIHTPVAGEAEYDRSARQAQVVAWVTAAFGEVQATDVRQRAVRFLEEAIELYQAAGAPKEMAHDLLDFVFSRPRGEVGQELGGVGVTVLALAAAAGVDADDVERAEIARVLSSPVNHWSARNAVKNAAGFKVTG